MLKRVQVMTSFVLRKGERVNFMGNEEVDSLVGMVEGIRGASLLLRPSGLQVSCWFLPTLFTRLKFACTYCGKILDTTLAWV